MSSVTVKYKKPAYETNAEFSHYTDSPYLYIKKNCNGFFASHTSRTGEEFSLVRNVSVINVQARDFQTTTGPDTTLVTTWKFYFLNQTQTLPVRVFEPAPYLDAEHQIQ